MSSVKLGAVFIMCIANDSLCMALAERRLYSVRAGIVSSYND